METFWGVDLGGTKIEGVIMPIGSSDPICRHRIDTEADRGYEHIVHRIQTLIGEIEGISGIKRASKIGFGTPGALDSATGLMKNCNTTSLNGRPLPSDLAAAIGADVVVANDANCLALAEATLGAAKGAATVFGVIMGTGVGGGVVVNGRVLNGAQGIAGEWGHNVLIPNGERCYCGKQGCVEMVISGPRLQAFYESLTGQKRSLREIVARVDQDEAAQSTINRLVDYFGQAISVVINILDPEIVVIGGGVGNVSRLYTDGVRSAEKYIFNGRDQGPAGEKIPRPPLRTKIVPPILGDSAGVFGAAMLTR